MQIHRRSDRCVSMRRLQHLLSFHLVHVPSCLCGLYLLGSIFCCIRGHTACVYSCIPRKISKPELLQFNTSINIILYPIAKMLLQPVRLLLSTVIPLFLLAFPSPVIGATACIHGTCLGDSIPMNCDSAAIYPAPPVPAGRRRVRGSPAPPRDTSPTLPRDTEVDSSSAVNARGNPICYYVNGRLSNSIGPLQVTNSFVIPAGTWALKWALRNHSAVNCMYYPASLLPSTFPLPSQFNHG